jgi:hypothetical protein
MAPAQRPFRPHQYLRFPTSGQHSGTCRHESGGSILLLSVGLGQLGGGVRIMRHVASARGFIAICMAVAFAFLAFNFSVTGQATEAGSGAVCTTISGILARAKLFSCTDAAGTGGSGHFRFQDPTTIKWANGDTTTVSPFSATAVPNGKLCAAGSEEFTLSGTVSADTTGTIEIEGKVSGVACVNQKTNTIVNARGKKFKVL